ncbi:hypothetical protein [Aureliella helgolandensis]|uniref:Uncharacterized protein n=1 Tax=Aureliella helgolandensis TaxID=2527968 RepID=A0A518GF76_9BACT|nr:hypothetical protein [Aureliella helgolandensis]QDV27210.1 hypothetical protein Q31a_55980 [Aureliella helgolandensis]
MAGKRKRRTSGASAFLLEAFTLIGIVAIAQPTWTRGLIEPLEAAESNTLGTTSILSNWVKPLNEIPPQSAAETSIPSTEPTRPTQSILPPVQVQSHPAAFQQAPALQEPSAQVAPNSNWTEPQVQRPTYPPTPSVWVQPFGYSARRVPLYDGAAYREPVKPPSQWTPHVELY